MIVWIVLEAYDYEGFSSPTGAFSTLAAARAKADEIRAGTAPPDDVVIFECIVDGAVTEAPPRSAPRTAR